MRTYSGDSAVQPALQRAAERAQGGSRPRRGGRLAAVASFAILLLWGPLPALSQEVPTGDDTPLRSELRLRPDRSFDLSFFLPPGVMAPEGLLARLDRGEATRADGSEEVELAWTGLSEAEALALLLEGRSGDAAFSVRILMSPGVAFDDIWEVQTVLTQAGIRRVRFVSGP